MVGFIAKPTIFCVIARPQRGRGNLKAKGMASRNEARQQETTESRVSRASAAFTRPKAEFHCAAMPRQSSDSSATSLASPTASAS